LQESRASILPLRLSFQEQSRNLCPLVSPPSPEPGFAGAIFAYNITFFFPLVLASFVCWSVALAFYIRFLRGGSHRTILKIALPFVLLLACPWQLAIIARVLLTPLPPPPS
jgi:hypothetical protein